MVQMLLHSGDRENYHCKVLTGCGAIHFVGYFLFEYYICSGRVRVNCSTCLTNLWRRENDVGSYGIVQGRNPVYVLQQTREPGNWPAGFGTKLRINEERPNKHPSTKTSPASNQTPTNFSTPCIGQSWKRADLWHNMFALFCGKFFFLFLKRFSACCRC